MDTKFEPIVWFAYSGHLCIMRRSGCSGRRTVSLDHWHQVNNMCTQTRNACLPYTYTMIESACYSLLFHDLIHNSQIAWPGLVCIHGPYAPVLHEYLFANISIYICTINRTQSIYATPLRPVRPIGIEMNAIDSICSPIRSPPPPPRLWMVAVINLIADACFLAKYLSKQ